MSGSMYRSGLVTNRGLEHISNVRNGDQTVKLLSTEIVVTSDFKNKADQALAEIAKCKKDLEASKAEAAEYEKTNLYIKEGIKNGTLVIENRKLVEKKISGGQRKTKSKKSKKSKKRKYKRSKHRHTKKPN